MIRCSYFKHHWLNFQKCLVCRKEVKASFPYYYRRRDGIVKFGDIPKVGVRISERCLWKESTGVRPCGTTKIKTKPSNMIEKQKIYCRNDVRILMQSIQEFRRLFKEKTQLDPLNRSFTIAGVSFEFFRATFMKDNKFHICPQKGYFNHNQSASGNAFLDQWNKDSLEKYNKPVIREYRIGQYAVDGFIDLIRCPRRVCQRNRFGIQRLLLALT